MMVHFPSSPQSGHDLSSSSSPSSSGHTVMYSFLVFALLGTVIALVSAILYFKRSKTREKRRKHSKPEDEHSGTQIRPKMNERKERSFVKLTSFPTSITPVQVNRYTSSSSPSSSSSSLEETEREDGEKFWRYNLHHEHRGTGLPHDMGTCQVTTKEKEPNGDRSPRLTFSLRVVPTSREERIHRQKQQSGREVKSIHLTLVQALNLKRSYVDPSTSKNSFSPLTSPGDPVCSMFQAEGVFARIFPSSVRKVKNANLSSSSPSSYEKERIGEEEERIGEEEERIEDFDSSTTAGDESWMRMKEEGLVSEERDVIETPVIKSQRSKDISFNDFSIPLEKFHFPVRVTLYEVDRNGVRFSLGHTFILLPHNFDTSFVVQTNKLYSTIYRAKNSIKFIK